MAHEALKWYDDKPDHPPWIKALLSSCAGDHRAIDQYAEAALGNRKYFLNRPYRIG